MEPKNIIDALSKPFGPELIKQRKVGRRQVDYVGGESYIARLNEATPEWSFRIIRDELRTLMVNRWDDAQRKSVPTPVPCQMIHAELEIPGVGTRAGIGVQLIEDGAGEDVVKGALTDAFKNCCKYFNLGLHLYSDDTPDASGRSAPPQQARSSQRGANTSQRPAQQATGPSPLGEQDVPMRAAHDFSGDDQWQKTNTSLHAAAGDAIPNRDDAHDVLHIMAGMKGFDSIKHVPVPQMLKFREFIRGPQWRDYYVNEIEPRLADLRLAKDAK